MVLRSDPTIIDVSVAHPPSAGLRNRVVTNPKGDHTGGQSRMATHLES
jgi:hypothetical protein